MLSNPAKSLYGHPHLMLIAPRYGALIRQRAIERWRFRQRNRHGITFAELFYRIGDLPKIGVVPCLTQSELRPKMPA